MGHPHSAPTRVPTAAPGSKIPAAESGPGTPSSRARVARRALLGAVILGILADPLLRNEPWGLGLLVWIVGFATVVIVLLRHAGRLLSPESSVWLAVAVLFAAGLSWRDAEVLLVFDLAAMLTALVLLAMSINAIPVPGLALARVRDLIRTRLEPVSMSPPAWSRSWCATPSSTPHFARPPTGAPGGSARRC
jgi:hypothetical protein